MDENSWKTISATEYTVIFKRFGGSFVVHPDVVAVVSTLAKRSVRYVGLAQHGRFIAAVPLWGEHIVATTVALWKYGALDLIDIGDSEVILPVAEDQLVTIPFKARMISGLHVNNIANIERDSSHLDASNSMMIAKSLHEHSGKNKREKRRETRRFLELGGRFRPISELTVAETLEVYTTLYKKRWGDTAVIDGFNGLSTVFRELKHMIRGDILLFNDRPVAMELLYAHETPHWLFVSGVKRVSDPEFRSQSVGSVLSFRNLEQLENEASARNKVLRHCYGWNDAPYKAEWAFPQPAYRLTDPQDSLSGDQTQRENSHTFREQTERRFTEPDFVNTQPLEAPDRAELSRQYLARRSVLEQIFFRSDGRPIQPLYRLLFHASGQPRRVFRRLVLHKNGTPRGLFSHWMQNRASVLSDLDRKFHRNI